MPRRKATVTGVGAADLTYAVNRLIAAGKTTAREIAALAAERPARIEQLERELQALRSGGPPARGPGRPRGSRNRVKRKRRFTMTPKARRARKIQGRYLGLLRKLDARQKADVRKVAQAQGVAAGIKAAERAVKAARPSS